MIVKFYLNEYNHDINGYTIKQTYNAVMSLIWNDDTKGHSYVTSYSA